MNKKDPEELPYDQIIPPSFEPVYDVALLDKPSLGNIDKLVNKLKQKYNIQEAEIVEEEPEEDE